MSGQGRLTTHVLDTANGHPARGMEIDLFRLDDHGLSPLLNTCTNEDGRCDAPLLSGDAFRVGIYELHFHVGSYLRLLNGGEPKFLDVVPVRFRIAEPDGHYHVPLLVSPFGYVTYRGS